MDVNRISGNTYVAPLPPTPGSGEFSSAPQAEAAPVAVAPPPPRPVAEPRPADRAEREEGAVDSLRRAVDEINSSVAIYRRHLGIRFHEPTNRRIVTVYDSDTNEALREIPPERILEAHASMLEMVGLFVNTRG